MEDEMTTLRKLVYGLALGCFLAPWSAASAQAACDTTLKVNLPDGDGVSVELRSGTPGSSQVVSRKTSVGGHVTFSGICPGSYFMAIGNQDAVEVTPVHVFDDDMSYESTISMQSGTGNIGRRQRGDL
jgi:hypothetical protein